MCRQLLPRFSFLFDLSKNILSIKHLNMWEIQKSKFYPRHVPMTLDRKYTHDFGGTIGV